MFQTKKLEIDAAQSLLNLWSETCQPEKIIQQVNKTVLHTLFLIIRNNFGEKNKYFEEKKNLPPVLKDCFYFFYLAHLIF